MERYLGGLERQFYQQNLIGSTNICTVLRLQGHLDLERLRQASQRLGEAYPLLLASIVANPHLRFSLAEAPQSIPFEVLPMQGEDHWRLVLETELNRHYKRGEGLAALTVLLGKGGYDILLSADHSLVDGLSVSQLCRRLLEFYNERSEIMMAYAGPMEKRFPRQFRGFRGWWRAFRFIFTLGKLGPALQIGSSALTEHTLSYGFTFYQAAELNALARAQGCNLFAAFSAVALKSIFELYGRSPSERLSLNTPVSLRAGTGTAADEIGVFLAGHMALYEVSQETKTWDLARQSFVTLKQGIEQGRPFLLALLARGARQPKQPKISSFAQDHRPTISISNLGRVDDFPVLPSAQVVEHHAVSAQGAKDPFALVLLSYQGKLYVDLQVSLEKMGREAGPSILARIQENLQRLLEEQGEGADAKSASLGAQPLGLGRYETLPSL